MVSQVDNSPTKIHSVSLWPLVDSWDGALISTAVSQLTVILFFLKATTCPAMVQLAAVLYLVP